MKILLLVLFLAAPAFADKAQAIRDMQRIQQLANESRAELADAYDQLGSALDSLDTADAETAQAQAAINTIMHERDAAFHERDEMRVSRDAQRAWKWRWFWIAIGEACAIAGFIAWKLK